MSDEKTLPASESRRRQARERGMVVRSSIAASVAVIGSVALAFAVWGPSFVESMKILLSGTLTSFGDSNADPLSLLSDAFTAGVGIVLPIGVTALVAGVAANLVQGGWSWGWNRSGRAVLSLRTAVWSLAMVSIVWAAFAWTLWSEGASIFASTDSAAASIGSFALRALALLSIVAAADYWWLRRRHEASLALSPSEAMEEVRQSEGDPAVRARRKKLHRLIVASPIRESRVGREVDAAQASGFAGSREEVTP